MRDPHFPIVAVVGGVGVVLLLLVVGALTLTKGDEPASSGLGAGYGAAESCAWCDGKDGTNPTRRRTRRRRGTTASRSGSPRRSRSGS